MIPRKKHTYSALHQQSAGFRGRVHMEKTWIDRVSDFFMQWFGTVSFFALNALFFILWMAINAGLIPFIPVFDPAPFGLLTLIVSLEAIFLSIIVLISQNREGQIADLRDEVDFEVNVRAENEITTMLTMLDHICKRLDIKVDHTPEFKSMQEKTDIEKIGRELSS